MLSVAVFDEENEEDLESALNSFLEKLNDGSVIDIKYQTSHFLTTDGEQIFSYSALLIYKVPIIK